MFVAERDLFNPRGAGEKAHRREAATSRTSLQRLAGKELISPLAATGAGPVQQVVMGQLGATGSLLWGGVSVKNPQQKGLLEW